MMESLYLQGNNLIAAKNYEDAVPIYQKAIEEYQKSSMITSLTIAYDGKDATKFINSRNVLEALQHDANNLSILIRCCANLGFAQWKLRDFTEAIECFNEIIEFEHRLKFIFTNNNNHPFLTELTTISLKALIRRCLCYETIPEYEKCSQDFEQIRLCYESDTSNLRSVILNLMPQYPTYQVKIQNLIKKDENVAKEEGKSDWMSHLHQALRVLLLSPLHRNIAFHCSSITRWDQLDTHRKYYCYSVEINCKLGLGNELGLFNRSLYLTSERQQLGQLTCRLRVMEDEGRIGNLSNTKIVFISTEPICPYPLINVENDHCNINYSEIREILQSRGSNKHALSFPLADNGKVNVDLYVNVLVPVEEIEQTTTANIDHPLLTAMMEFEVMNFPSANVPIIPLMSNPFQIHQNHLNENQFRLQLKDLQSESSSLSCVRPIKLSNSSNSVYVYESPGMLGIGGKIWDSTFVLIDYLSKHAKDLIQDEVVVELGSGTGITGLSLAFLSPRKVVMTDMTEVVPLMIKNIELNQMMQSDERAHHLLRNSYAAYEYLWGSHLDPHSPLFADFKSSALLVASDVVYYPEGYRPLVETLEWWFSLPLDNTNVKRRTKRMILAHRHRHPQDSEFFALIRSSKILQMTEITRDLTNEGVKDVRLFLLTHKS